MLTPRLFLSVLVISELWTYILARETILAFYDEDTMGAIQQKVYSLGAASFKNISVDILYKQCQVSSLFIIYNSF